VTYSTKPISVGDIVIVNMNEAAMTIAHKARVMFVPAHEGDMCHFAKENGDVIATNERISIIRSATP